MREIKFRIWDGKQFLTNSLINDRAIDFGGVDGNDIGLELKSNGLGKNYVFQQFTGLKDKTGRDIYDGDIVKFLNGLLYEIKHGQWKHVDCPWPLYGWFAEKDGWQWGLSGESEIIGNIFENPELLS